MITHLKHYLSYYSSLKSPEFAVLVTGEWGAGKTYQVKNCLPDDGYYYISLFGLDSVDAIHDAVLAEMAPLVTAAREHFPVLAKSILASLGVPSFNSIIPGLCRAILRNKVKIDRTLVFDDLERSTVCIRDVTGAINNYIEHHKCRVIIIAHDEEILGHYQNMKEKTVGQVIHVEPDTVNALSCFIDEHSGCDSEAFLRSIQEDLIQVFDLSGTQSLRILRHVVRDVRRIYEALTPRHTVNRQALMELTRLHSALNFEIRSGNLKRDDLRERGKTKLHYEVSGVRDGRGGMERQGDDKTPPIVIADEKYSFVDLGSTLLGDDVLIEMLIQGIYDVEHIRASINSSSYFLEVNTEETPAWKIIFDFYKMEDGDVRDALSTMSDQFRQRKLVDSGEILHVFALRLMMASKGIEGESMGNVMKECKDYVDESLENGSLTAASSQMHRSMDIWGAHDGYQYWVEESYKSQFDCLREYLETAMEIAWERQLEDKASELLLLLTSNGREFALEITTRGDQLGTYGGEPILHKLQPPEFLGAWLNNPRSDWGIIRQALEWRYKNNREILNTEQEWLAELSRELDRRAGEVENFERLRLNWLKPKVERLPNG